MYLVAEEEAEAVAVSAYLSFNKTCVDPHDRGCAATLH